MESSPLLRLLVSRKVAAGPWIRLFLPKLVQMVSGIDLKESRKIWILRFGNRELVRVSPLVLKIVQT